jgi:hypothetical protein
MSKAKALLSVVGIILSCDPCGDAQCPLVGLVIVSPGDDLVSAEGCGSVGKCTRAHCTQLLVPPPSDGGTCPTTITFADGGTLLTQVDWGTPHDASACCGPTFDQNTPTITVHADAGTD